MISLLFPLLTMILWWGQWVRYYLPETYDSAIYDQGRKALNQVNLPDKKTCFYSFFKYRFTSNIDQQIHLPRNQMWQREIRYFHGICSWENHRGNIPILWSQISVNPPPKPWFCLDVLKLSTESTGVRHAMETSLGMAAWCITCHVDKHVLAVLFNISWERHFCGKYQAK